MKINFMLLVLNIFCALGADSRIALSIHSACAGGLLVMIAVDWIERRKHE